MAQKSTRILVVIVGLGLCALIARSCANAEDEPQPGNPPPAVPSDPPETSSTGPEWDPEELFGGAAVETATPGATNGAARSPVIAWHDAGPRLPDGTEVDLRLDWQVGTKTNYEVMEAEQSTERNGAIPGYVRQTTRGITTEVIEAGPDGSRRIRMTVDWVQLRFHQQQVVEFQWDSRKPDAEIEKHEAAGQLVAIAKSAIGRPVVFSIGADGVVTSVKGFEAWEETAEETFELRKAGSARANPPVLGDTEEWRFVQLLFPPVVGETRTSGTPWTERFIQDREPMRSGYVISNEGKSEVTHDKDGQVRVLMFAKPGFERRPGGSTGSFAKQVAKVNVVSSEDAYRAAWRFERSPARLVGTEIDTKYTYWESHSAGAGPMGAPVYKPYFFDIQRVARVKVVDGPDDAE